MLPSLVVAVIVTFPFAFAITLASFPITSIDAIFSSLVVHSISLTSASSFIVAVKILLLPTYKLSILLFIVILSANTTSFFTVTFIVFVASPPLLSFTLYVTSYSPGVFSSTVFFKTSISAIFPSSLSVAVTPVNGSKLSPTFITLSVAFITGGSFTVITIVFIALAPSVSVTLYVTSYFPDTFMLTSFFITCIFSVIFPSSLSLAVTPSSSLNSSPNCITLSSAFITGILFIKDALGFTITTLWTLVVLFPLSVALYITL